MSGEHGKKERNPEKCQSSRGMADRLEMGGRQALQTTSSSDQQHKEKKLFTSHMEKNSHYWVYTTTLFTNSLTEDSQSLPKVGIIITFYTWATGGLERLAPAQQSPHWEVWRASYDPSLLLPEPQLFGTKTLVAEDGILGRLKLELTKI